MAAASTKTRSILKQFKRDGGPPTYSNAAAAKPAPANNPRCPEQILRLAVAHSVADASDHRG